MPTLKLFLTILHFTTIIAQLPDNCVPGSFITGTEGSFIGGDNDEVSVTFSADIEANRVTFTMEIPFTNEAALYLGFTDAPDLV